MRAAMSTGKSSASDSSWPPLDIAESEAGTRALETDPSVIRDLIAAATTARPRPALPRTVHYPGQMRTNVAFGGPLGATAGGLRAWILGAHRERQRAARTCRTPAQAADATSHTNSCPLAMTVSCKRFCQTVCVIARRTDRSARRARRCLRAIVEQQRLARRPAPAPAKHRHRRCCGLSPQRRWGDEP